MPRLSHSVHRDQWIQWIQRVGCGLVVARVEGTGSRYEAVTKSPIFARGMPHSQRPFFSRSGCAFDSAFDSAFNSAFDRAFLNLGPLLGRKTGTETCEAEITNSAPSRYWNATAPDSTTFLELELPWLALSASSYMGHVVL